MVLEARWLPSHLLARQVPLVPVAPLLQSARQALLVPKDRSFLLRQLGRQDLLVLEAPWRRSRPLTRLAPKAPSFPLRQLGRQDPQVLEAPLRQSLPSRLPTRQVLLVQ